MQLIDDRLAAGAELPSSPQCGVGAGARVSARARGRLHDPRRCAVLVPSRRGFTPDSGATDRAAALGVAAQGDVLLALQVTGPRGGVGNIHRRFPTTSWTVREEPPTSCLRSHRRDRVRSGASTPGRWEHRLRDGARSLARELHRAHGLSEGSRLQGTPRHRFQFVIDPMAFDTILYEGSRPATITLNLPDRLNALIPGDDRELREPTRRPRPTKRVVLLVTVTGRRFCPVPTWRYPRRGRVVLP